MREANKYSLVLKHGVKIYPVYQHNDVKAQGSIVFNKNSWYIEVDNNGQIKRYQKIISTGKILRSTLLEKKMKLTIDYWYNKIKSQLK